MCWRAPWPCSQWKVLWIVKRTLEPEMPAYGPRFSCSSYPPSYRVRGATIKETRDISTVKEHKHNRFNRKTLNNLNTKPNDFWRIFWILWNVEKCDLFASMIALDRKTAMILSKEDFLVSSCEWSRSVIVRRCRRSGPIVDSECRLPSGHAARIIKSNAN